MTTFWQLTLLGLLATLLSVRLLSLGLPMHMDEFDYLFVGRQFIEGSGWPSLTYIFGADFNWYLFAFFDQHLGGYPGARVLSFALGLVALAGSWALTFAMWGSHKKAMLATLLLALSAQHIFVSSITTYDIVALALLSWSAAFLWMLIGFNKGVLPGFSLNILNHSQASGLRLTLFSLSLLTLFLAVLSKYVVILFLPPLFLLALVTVPAYALAGAVVLAGALVTYFVANRTALETLYETQIKGVHGVNATHADLLQLVGESLMLPLAVITLVIVIYFIRTLVQVFKNTARHTAASTQHETGKPGRGPYVVLTFSFPYIPLLLCLALALPAYHVWAQNRIALPKHLAFSLVFLMPIVAHCLIALAETLRQYTRWTLIPGFLVGVFILVFSANSRLQYENLNRAYPDLTDMIAYWTSSDAGDTSQSSILSEDPYLFRYLANSETDQALIRETAWLDANEDGQHTAEDVTEALHKQQFEWVLLTDQLHPKRNTGYRHILAVQGYQAVFTQPYYLSAQLSGNRMGVVALYKRP